MTAIMTAPENTFEFTQWRDTVMEIVNNNKRQLLQRDDYLAWEAEQLSEQLGLWTRDDCLAKVIMEQYKDWPLPAHVPAWATKVEIEKMSYREIWVCASHRIERNGVRLEVSIGAYLDIGYGEITGKDPLVWVYNSANPHDDFTLEQLATVSELSREIIDLITKGDARELVRMTEPGGPEQEGIGGGL